jgi:hypothetical protein
LAVVIAVGDPRSGVERASLSTWLVVAAVLGPTLVLCVLGARIWKGRPVSAVLLALVAGTSLALFAVLTKGVVEVAEGGAGAVVTAPEFIPWLVTALCGMIFQQSAFRAGALTASLPTMTVCKPVVAGVLGVTVLEETLAATGPWSIVLVAAVAMVFVATFALARGEAASVEAEVEHDAVPHGARPEPVPGAGAPPVGGVAPAASEGIS